MHGDDDDDDVCDDVCDDVGASLTAEGSSVVFVYPDDALHEHHTPQPAACFTLLAAKVSCLLLLPFVAASSLPSLRCYSHGHLDTRHGPLMCLVCLVCLARLTACADTGAVAGRGPPHPLGAGAR